MTEMMIAVAVLLVVIIATSRIFSTASQITGIGTATTSLLRTAAAIEQQMRDDLARLTPEGFFVIHSVAVRNDARGVSGALLDPSKPVDYRFRCDQLMFFANGVQSPMTFRSGAGNNRDGQGTASRVLYSHGFQVPNMLPVKTVNASRVDAYDPAFIGLTAGLGYVWTVSAGPGTNGQLTPWYPSNGQPLTVAMTGTVFQDANGAAPGDYSTAAYAPSPINFTQPPSNQWILAREPLVMADDDANSPWETNKVVFLNNSRALYSIFPLASLAPAPANALTAVRKGRVDAVAENLNDVRRLTTMLNATTPLPWISTGAVGTTQRGRMMRAMYYPRAEAKAPGMHRVDQALTNNALAIGCSSLRIDWTYADGTGAALDANGRVVQDINGSFFNGVGVNPAIEHPWFGLRDPASSVYNYGDPLSPFVSSGNLILATTIDANNIEVTSTSSPAAPAPPSGVIDYWAVFGYNQTMPFHNAAIDPDGTASSYTGAPSRVYYGAGSEPNSSNSSQIAFTPWPTAIRVTMVLTDPEGRLEGGREFQFVIDLPKRVP